MTPRLCAAVLVLASVGAGCGAHPTKPEPPGIELRNLNPPEPSAATLEIRDFVVTSGYDAQGGYFWYIPTLTLAETSGVSGARIGSITFELLDIGPAGKVPNVEANGEVPPGGTVRPLEDEYWGPWAFITNRLEARRVSVTIPYRDHLGRVASVGAIAQVSR